jgi:hypothetical protein
MRRFASLSLQLQAAANAFHRNKPEREHARVAMLVDFLFIRVGPRPISQDRHCPYSELVVEEMDAAGPRWIWRAGSFCVRESKARSSESELERSLLRNWCMVLDCELLLLNNPDRHCQILLSHLIRAPG